MQYKKWKNLVGLTNTRREIDKKLKQRGWVADLSKENPKTSFPM